VSDKYSPKTLTAEEFRVDLGTSFRLSTGPHDSDPAGSFELKLVEVSEHGTGSPGPFRAPFSLLFHGPLEPVLPQAIYRLEHERLGTQELFIVPVGPEVPAAPGQAPTAMRYEIVFN
jgi:hypothetical protein